MQRPASGKAPTGSPQPEETLLFDVRASQRRGPGLISRWIMWALWWTKWHWDRVLRIPLSILIPPDFPPSSVIIRSRCSRPASDRNIKWTQSQYNLRIIKKFWKEIIAYFPSVRHAQHRKQSVQQFLYCCVCICCCGNMFTELLFSNNKGDTYTVTEQNDLMILFLQNMEDGLKNIWTCLPIHNNIKTVA